MIRAHWLGLVLLLSPAAGWAANSEEEAGDVAEVDKDATGPLKDRIPPVSGHLFLHKKRFELSPTVTFSLTDAFYNKYVFGLDLAYHFTENLAIDGRFGYSLPTVSGAAQICIPQGSPIGRAGCSQPTMQALSGVAPGEINLVGSLDLEWAPLYGKIALVSESFLHFDLYGLVGPAFVMYTGPGANSAPGAANPVSFSTVGGNLGVGMRFFLNKWIAVRLELRDLIYPETVLSFLPNGNGQTTTVRNQLMFDLALSMFFPTAFQEY